MSGLSETAHGQAGFLFRTGDSARPPWASMSVARRHPVDGKDFRGVPARFLCSPHFRGSRRATRSFIGSIMRNAGYSQLPTIR
jgi:hypothetical protein